MAALNKHVNWQQREVYRGHIFANDDSGNAKYSFALPLSSLAKIMIEFRRMYRPLKYCLWTLAITLGRHCD